MRDVTVLVGPNGSGKTTVLNAIGAAMSSATRMRTDTHTPTRTPRGTVRPGATRTRVTCDLRFSVREIEAARELHEHLASAPGHTPLRGSVPGAENVAVTWTYPDPTGISPAGSVTVQPADAEGLLLARATVEHAIRSGLLRDLGRLKLAGRVVAFDQQRTTLGKSIRQDVWRVIQGAEAGDGRAASDERWTTDPRTILLDLAIKSQVPGPGDDEFKRIQDEYARICAPRRIIGPIRDDLGALDIQFSDGVHEYGYDGVSSGEAMVLLFLIKMVSERVHNSIVLVDEIELHQHPVWQRRLLHLLPRMGESNQIIATTHSDYLRDVLPRGAVWNMTAPPLADELVSVLPAVYDAGLFSPDEFVLLRDRIAALG